MNEEEIKKPIEETPLEQLRDQATTMRLMLKTSGFAVWAGIVKGQEEARIMELYQPIKQEAVLEQEFRKGEMQGYSFAVKLWDFLLKQMEEEIEQRSKPEHEGRTEK